MANDEGSADMARPVFRTDGFEEIDESWQWGAYIGGMAGAHKDAGIASDYKKAADQLVEQAMAEERMHEVVLPALFLYRHAIELRLKFAVRPKKPDHKLPALLDVLNAAIKAKRGFGLTADVDARIREIAAIDPGSVAFRYHAAKPSKDAVKAGRSGDVHLPLEVWVDLAHLRDIMRRIDRELAEAAETISDVSDPERMLRWD